MDDEKITMEEAARFAGFSLDTRKNITITDCPFCGGKEKFYISLSLPYNPLGLAHCMRCGETLSSIGMFARAKGLNSNKEASKAWHKLRRGEADEEANLKFKQIRQKPRTEIKRVDVDPAPIEIRDKTYRNMLSLLALLPEHKNNLLKRGLTEKAIEEAEYRSLPRSEKNIALIVQSLLQRGCVLKGVPGFFQRSDGKWTMVSYKGEGGILLPQRNGFGQIQGFQIRRDTDVKSKRYIALSSRDYPNGSPAYTYCHLRRGNKGLEEIILTEGPLKADVISCLTGYSVLAVPGVNSLGFLPQALYDLKAAGVQKVCIAYDMDIRVNKEVQKAQKKLMSLLKRAGIHYSVLNWDESLKGLDDWAEANIKK